MLDLEEFSLGNASLAPSTSEVKGAALLRRPATEGSDFDRRVSEVIGPQPQIVPKKHKKGANFIHLISIG